MIYRRAKVSDLVKRIDEIRKAGKRLFGARLDESRVSYDLSVIRRHGDELKS